MSKSIEQIWRNMAETNQVDEALNSQMKRVAEQLKKLMEREKNVQKKMKLADEVMATILGEEHGAGEWGTDKLRKTYAKDTPGQTPNSELAIDGVPTVGGVINKPDPFKGASAVQKPKGVSLSEDPDDEGWIDEIILDEAMTQAERIAAIRAAHQKILKKEKQAERDAKRDMSKSGAQKGMAPVKVDEKKKLDPVGKADADIDNDGDVDKSDSYLHNRRKAIKKAMKKEEVEAVDEVTYVPGFVGADGKATSKPTAKDYAANKEYQSMKKKLGNKIPGPKPTKEDVEAVDETSEDYRQPSWARKAANTAAKINNKLKKSVSDFRKSDVAAQIRKNKTTKTMEAVDVQEVKPIEITKESLMARIMEISSSTAAKVAKQRAINVGSAAMNANGDRRDPDYQKAIAKKKRNDSLTFSRGAKAADKVGKALSKEEVEQVDEISKGLASRYIKRAVGSAISNADKTQYHTSKMFHKQEKGDNKGAKKEYKAGRDPSRKTMNRFYGIQRAAGKLNKNDKDKGEYLGHSMTKQKTSSKVKATEQTQVDEYITGKQIRMAKGIAFDKRHKGGDYTGAAKKMEKIKKGLSNHPAVKKALRTANESMTPNSHGWNIQQHAGELAKKDGHDIKKLPYGHAQGYRDKAKKALEKNEAAQPTGVKIYHKDKKTGKESWSIHFTARDAQKHVDQMKKAGHTETKRSLMFGDKEGKPRIMSK